MSKAVSIITEQVRERVRRDGVDFGGERAPGDTALIDDYVRDEVRRYSEKALGGSLPMLGDEKQAARDILASIVGFGPLQPLFDDPEIEEIWLNGPEAVFVARNGVSERTGIVLSSGQLRDLVERMLHSTGRRIDLSSPFVDASLLDGSRLHAVIPDVVRDWSINIRKFLRRINQLHHLVERGSLTPLAAQFLRMCVLSGHNVIVSGATQSGKTTLLGTLLSASRASDRIVTVEETFELDLAAADVVAMQCRQPSLEGTGEITLRRLIKEALRMRPDRLVVGEVREAEALDLLIALNSGIPGACSIHANSAKDALAKLSLLPLLAGRNIDAAFVVPTVASVVDVIVHCELQRDGHRRVTEIIAPTGAVDGGQIESVSLFSLREGMLVSSGSLPPRLEKFRAAGFDPAAILRLGF